jgi:hypothetical protein
LQARSDFWGFALSAAISWHDLRERLQSKPNKNQKQNNQGKKANEKDAAWK